MFDRRFERFKLKKVMMMMRKELMLHMLMTVAITRKTDRQNKTDRERESRSHRCKHRVRQR